jgi:hypothetical protein
MYITRRVLLRTLAAIGAIIGACAAFITVFGFLTGDFSLSQIFVRSSTQPTVADLTPFTSTSLPSTATPISTAPPTIIYQNSLLAPDSRWEPDQNCFFASDGFHVKPNLACQSPIRNLRDVDVSVQMKQISGTPTDLNGIEVRRSGNPASLYEFDIDANGEWSFEVCIRSFDNCGLLASGSNPAIRTGVGATNTVEIRAVGAQFTLLVNGAEVGQASDPSLAAGDVWLDTGGTAECVFTNFTAIRPT